MLGLLFAAHCLFTPPSNWKIADPKTPSQRMIVGFLDKRRSGFCPSMHLTHETVNCSTRDYIETIKKRALAKKYTVREMGSIKTQSGIAYLLEIETTSPFGPVRLMQAILHQNEDVFVLTSGALKKHFGKYAEEIQKSIRSLSIHQDVFALAKDRDKELREAWQKKVSGVESESFDQMVYSLSELGPVWQLIMSSL